MQRTMTEVLIGGAVAEDKGRVNPGALRWMVKRSLVVFVMLLLLGSMSACALFGSQITIAENERGVFIDDQGKFQVLPPGTHALSPFAGKTVIYPMTDQVYTMTGQLGTEGSVIGNDAIEARSKDGRQLWIDSAVTFHFVESRLIDVHRMWQDPEDFVNGFIRPTTRTVIYNTANRFNRDEVLSSKRSKVEATISQQLTDIFAQQGAELVKFSLLDVRGN